MRTTLRINDRLLNDAKRLAIDTGRTLTQVVEDSLRVALDQRHRKEAKPGRKFRTFTGNGLQPGVDLSSNAAVLDLMDEYDGLIGR